MLLKNLYHVTMAGLFLGLQCISIDAPRVLQQFGIKQNCFEDIQIEHLAHVSRDDMHQTYCNYKGSGFWL